MVEQKCEHSRGCPENGLLTDWGLGKDSHGVIFWILWGVFSGKKMWQTFPNRGNNMCQVREAVRGPLLLGRSVW